MFAQDAIESQLEDIFGVIVFKWPSGLSLLKFYWPAPRKTDLETIYILLDVCRSRRTLDVEYNLHEKSRLWDGPLTHCLM